LHDREDLSFDFFARPFEEYPAQPPPLLSIIAGVSNWVPAALGM
jgi:hypothetical protein